MNLNPRNYQKELDKALLYIAAEPRVPTLLLHSCCAPCSSYVIRYLSSFFEIIVYYYNPNIFPDEEYLHRKKEQIRLLSCIDTKNPVTFLEGDYDPALFDRVAEGLESEPEGGARCRECFSLRLSKTAEQARDLGAVWFSTTLTVSPHKSAALINEIGERFAKEFGCRWLPSDFKKKSGYLKSIELSKEYGLYRQKYCGCRYSIREPAKKEKEECNN